jgi:hypothetical protein
MVNGTGLPHVPGGPQGEGRSQDELPAVSVVIRIHDVGGLPRLERAIQSLHAQDGVRAQPIVVAQRLPQLDLEAIRVAVGRQWFFEGLPEPIFINLEDGGSGDARSTLMNLGIEEHLRSGNRYLGFLDHDDLLYSHAYRVLTDRLAKSGAAIAFASVEVADVIPLADYEFVFGMNNPYRGRNKMDLIRDNFCPLHSYLVDTSRVDSELLSFNPGLVRVEDYDFLLRVAGRYPCDFQSLDTKIGLYFRRADGSNSTPLGVGPVTAREPGNEWKQSLAKLNRLRAEYPVQFFASDFVSTP